MGRYISASDVLLRYGRLTSVHSASNIESSFIPFAEAEVDGNLSPVYTPPFSTNNLTAQDLSIDLVVIKAGLLKGEDHQRVLDYVTSRFGMLREGKELMVTDAGVKIIPTAPTEAYDTHEDYTPTFTMEDPILQELDQDLLDYESDRRE